MLESIRWEGLNQNTQQRLWRIMGLIGVRHPRQERCGVPTGLWSGVQKLLSPQPATLESEDERSALLYLVREALDLLRTDLRHFPSACTNGLDDVLAELILLEGQIRTLPLAA